MCGSSAARASPRASSARSASCSAAAELSSLDSLPIPSARTTAATYPGCAAKTRSSTATDRSGIAEDRLHLGAEAQEVLFDEPRGLAGVAARAGLEDPRVVGGRVAAGELREVQRVEPA